MASAGVDDGPNFINQFYAHSESVTMHASIFAGRRFARHRIWVVVQENVLSLAIGNWIF